MWGKVTKMFSETLLFLVICATFMNPSNVTNVIVINVLRGADPDKSL
jgi:hypothetical protein